MGERLELEGSPVDITRVAGCSHTEYSIKGSLEQVFRAIQGLFVEYHPCGYGTHVHSIATDDGEVYRARVSRLNSCD